MNQEIQTRPESWWTPKQLDHLARFAREDRGEACLTPHSIKVGDTEWIVSSDARVLVALVGSRLSPEVVEYPELGDDPSAHIIRQVMENKWGSTFATTMDKLRAWAGDPAAGPRPGSICEMTIDCRLLSDVLMTLPGPTVHVSTGKVRGVMFLTLRGNGWRALVVNFHLPLGSNGVPRFEDFKP